MTAFALIALTITSQTETANERLRRIFASGETSAIAGMPPRVAQLESETQLLVAQVRALTTERDRLSGRIALLESSIDDMSGAIKKQAAATAALLAARVNPPTTSPTVTSTPIATNPPTINADRDTTTASIPPIQRQRLTPPRWPHQCRLPALPMHRRLTSNSPLQGKASSAWTLAAE